jgi:hypothetical protein|tara:strand:- start:99 stop:335 length:237 start_codon:yes stop_codon:yes gene_type:complete
MAKTKPTIPNINVELDEVQDSLTNDLIDNLYMFFNRKRNLQVYINADSWEEAHDKFDTCQFQYPNDWEMYLKVKERSN